jgi:hypothetical protein
MEVASIWWTKSALWYQTMALKEKHTKLLAWAVYSISVILFYFSLFLPCVYTIHSLPLNISSSQHSPWHPYQQYTVMAFITSVTHRPSLWTSTCLHHAYLNRTPILAPYGAYHNQPYWLATHTCLSLITPILHLIYLLWLLFVDCVTLKMADIQYDPLKCVELLTQQCSESAAHQLWEHQISQYAGGDGV